MTKFYGIYEVVKFTDNQNVKVDFSKFGLAGGKNHESDIKETTILGNLNYGFWIIKIPEHLKESFVYSCISCPQWFIVKE